MNTYILFSNGVTDTYIEIEEELPSESYKLGTTWAEYLEGDTFVKLTDAQVNFRAAHTTASVKEVFDMTLAVIDELAAAKSRKLLEIEAADDASNEFFVNGISMWLKQDLRTTLVSNTIPALEARGKTSTLLWGWDSNGCPVSFDVPITALKQMLPDLEIYAKETYDLRMQNISSVNALNTVSEVENFDASENYPTKRSYNV